MTAVTARTVRTLAGLLADGSCLPIAIGVAGELLNSIVATGFVFGLPDLADATLLAEFPLACCIAGLDSTESATTCFVTRSTSDLNGAFRPGFPAAILVADMAHSSGGVAGSDFVGVW